MNFLDNMPVGRKLAVAFGTVLAAIVVMGVIVVFNILALERADEARALENKINRSLSAAEFRLSRVENSYRGYLLTQDPYYMERLDSHRAKFNAALAEARADLPANRQEAIDKALQGADLWYENVVQVGKAMIAEGRLAEAEQMVGQTGVADKFIAPVEGAIDESKAANDSALETSRKAQASAARAALIAMVVGLAGALFVAVAAGLAATRAIVRPTFSMVGYMQKLMIGDTSIQVAGADRKDEFGKMAQAIVAFRDAALDKVRVEQEALAHRSMSEQERAANEAEKARIAEEDRVALTALAEGLAAMSNGDLTHRFTVEVAPRSQQLKTDFNAAIAQLQQALSLVLGNGGVEVGLQLLRTRRHLNGEPVRQIAVRHRRQSLGQRCQRHPILLGDTRLLRLVGAMLGLAGGAPGLGFGLKADLFDRIVAEGPERDGHAADFISPPLRRDHDLQVAAGQLVHGARHRDDRLAERPHHPGGHQARNRQRQKPADHQGCIAGLERRLLLGVAPGQHALRRVIDRFHAAAYIGKPRRRGHLRHRQRACSGIPRLLHQGFGFLMEFRPGRDQRFGLTLGVVQRAESFGETGLGFVVLAQELVVACRHIGAHGVLLLDGRRQGVVRRLTYPAGLRLRDIRLLQAEQADQNHQGRQAAGAHHPAQGDHEFGGYRQ